MTDLEMLKNPDKWPAWPRLPLVIRHPARVSDPMTVGFLLGDPPSDGTYTVWFGNVFDPVYPTQPKKQYATVEELLKDGWEVD
jgi:hypothetical protein